MKARLTYHYSPATLVRGALSRNCWFRVYGRDGEVLVETTDDCLASEVADRFPEITGAEPETLADAAIDAEASR